MKRGFESGFTLLELLVAVAMLSLLAVGVSAALRIGLKGSEKAQLHIELDRRVLGAEGTLREQLSGLMPVGVLCKSSGGTLPTPVSFFQGSTESMRFVSSYSLGGAWRGTPRLVEYQVLAEKNNGGLRLIANELPWPIQAQNSPCSIVPQTDGSQEISFAPIAISPSSFVLADKLKYCHFLYRSEDNRDARWQDSWGTGNGWPSAIRVDMGPLVLNPNRVELSAVTVPIHARGNI